MNSYPLIRLKAGRLLLLMIGALIALPCAEAATNVVLWDTGSPGAEPAGGGQRAGWKSVPSELFGFEKDPAKAASDPGYYGREYSFRGEAVVENRKMVAVFSAATGRVAVYARAGTNPVTGTEIPGRKLFELAPLLTTSEPAIISRFEIVRNGQDEVVLEAFFSSKTAGQSSALFSFGRDEVVEIKPGPTMKGVTLVSPIEYGVVPGFVGDDLIFSPEEYPGAGPLFLPSENVCIGLLKGENDAIVLSWPPGKQQLKLNRSGDPAGRRALHSIDFESDGRSLYVTALSAPGIWHREELKPGHLEKDVAVAWKKPFAARWKTQLTEAGVRITFAFRESKGTIWRGVPGSYNYPAWFEGDTAFFHLSKKVPPKGEALIYFLEGEDTPDTISSPVAIVKATLGRSQSELLLDVAGRKLRTHHRRGGDGVHRACTCGCTEAIQAVFEAGQEVENKEVVNEALVDMIYFVERHVERIEEYRRFATDLTRFLREQGTAAPGLKPYLETLEQTVQQIPQEFEVQKENMKSREHVEDLTRRTLALTSRKSTNNLSAYMDLLKAWRAMGGAQDYVLAQCHTITRKLFQEAGYGGVLDVQAARLAPEIRARCRKVLRNPDGYEIWANY